MRNPDPFALGCVTPSFDAWVRNPDPLALVGCVTPSFGAWGA